LPFFGRPFVKQFALCYRTVVCSVCDVGLLWPNGWMDQDETWHRGRPWPHHIVLDGEFWEPSSPQRGTAASQFSVHVCCGQTAGWIKMPLGMAYGGRPRTWPHCCGDPAPPKEAQPRNFQPMSVVAKQLDGSRCHLVRR